ncbi:uncharacterized protein N7459_002427 [Penicillium hispanicum]|uniref:uncharacterized protein n=1 Tax=Penicillium hispanicum TaxID=1080232 RepID=UPI0025417E12|nr:uncharacterized protein N7459_002427 [Penicillium hispanicum]KAJ5586662.1 hypothetical protein N7459_002427 [Penicillium hispanicum]
MTPYLTCNLLAIYAALPSLAGFASAQMPSNRAAASTCVAHYVVQAGDNCDRISQSLPDMGGVGNLYAWNPQIHQGNCDNLVVSETLCVLMRSVPECPAH